MSWSGGRFTCSQILQSLVAGAALLSNALATPYLRGKGVLPHIVPPAAQTIVGSHMREVSNAYLLPSYLFEGFEGL